MTSADHQQADTAKSPHEQGVLNLLDACAGARRGDTMLIVEEASGLGFYDEMLGEIIADGAARYGLTVERLTLPFTAEIDAVPAPVQAALRDYDHVLFLSRIGDQLRFTAMPDGARPIVSYVLDRDALASSFANSGYRGFLDLKIAIDDLIFNAETIRITCPFGTDYAGRATSTGGKPGTAKDVTVRRFPISVFSPVPAASFSGRVAVMHGLAGTGSRYYAPYGLRIDQPVFAEVVGERIVGWHGPADRVSKVRAHYDDIAGRFGIERDFVHSWHAGIHPGCAYSGYAFDNLERWSGSAFGNPRLLHFHTCGAYAPGEICWNVVDPTIAVDGVAIWDQGRLHPERFEGGRAVLARHADLAPLFAHPRREIGL